jgi:nuclear cap-binding protein subunit 1
MHSPQITPETSSVVGYSIRTLIIDVVEAYGINRKEGAQVLVDLPRWLRRGIFFQPGLGPSDTLEGGKEAGWQLESTLIEVGTQ